MNQVNEVNWFANYEVNVDFNNQMCYHSLMEDTKKIQYYWPFKYQPRQNQLKAFDWLEHQDAKYIIIEAPVGSGKSNLAITYSQFLGQRTNKYRGDAFILTPQRILQKQYEMSFCDIQEVNLVSLYGKSNYECRGKNASCEIGGLVRPRCISCPHQEAKKQAQLAANTVLNYKLALTSFAFTDTFNKRKLMVLDECHTIEEHLVEFDALKITEARCKKYNLNFKLHKNLNAALLWLKETYLPKIQQVLTDLQNECESLYDKAGKDLSRTEVNKLRELDAFADHVDETHIMSLREHEYVQENFVLVWDKVFFQFKRLTGRYSFDKILKPYADKFLFMSSTILNKDGFCEDLGIDPKETAFLTLDSEFPTENRPVYFMPQMKMNVSWNQSDNTSDRKKMITSIQTLLDMHKDDSGIIHTGNFAIAQWLVSELSGKIKQTIYHHNPDSDDDRNSVITAFISSPKPGVLISPSLTEGLDLKEDLGRFAIFAKVPYGFLGDQWIKRRMEMSSEWYTRRALISMIQGGGRIVRSETDKGSVYILDSSFSMLYKRTFHSIPKWWREAYTIL